MTAPMMRTRQAGRPCRVEGHGSRCEYSEERRRWTRAQEKRQWRRESASSGSPVGEVNPMTDREEEVADLASEAVEREANRAPEMADALLDEINP